MQAPMSTIEERAGVMMGRKRARLLVNAEALEKDSTAYVQFKDGLATITYRLEEHRKKLATPPARSAYNEPKPARPAASTSS